MYLQMCLYPIQIPIPFFPNAYPRVHMIRLSFKFVKKRWKLKDFQIGSCSGKVKLVTSVNSLAFRFTFTIIDYRLIMLSNTNPQWARK